jgi:Lrp/AsnC family leucine-responsive transcriptional regulator
VFFSFLNKVNVMDVLIDDIDRAIVAALAEDARLSLKVLSARVGLTSPSTAERLKRLEERGIIQGYGARVNLSALGYTLQALVRVRPLPGLLQKVDKYIQAMPECIECDKVTGEDCFVMRLVVKDIAQLDTLLDGLAEFAQCNTSIVKSSPVKRRLPVI